MSVASGPAGRGLRALGLAWSLVLAAAFVQRGTAPDGFDPGLWQRNAARWAALSSGERDELRHAWQRFETLPAARREQLIQRADMLVRLRAARPASGADGRSSREASVDRGADEAFVLAELTRRAEDVRRHLLASGADAVERHGLARAVQVRAQRYVNAFLDNMVVRGLLPSRERAALMELGFREQAREALLLLKSERLALYSETPRISPLDVERLANSRSIEAVQAMTQRRRVDGFLGRLGELVPLGPEDRRVLAAAREWDVERLLFERHRATIVQLLERLGEPAERREELLALPLNELERELHALLAGTTSGR